MNKYFDILFDQDTRFSQNGSMSQLIYAPVHELDYGTILCWAGNNLGEQEEPCTFHIIPAGKKLLIQTITQTVSKNKFLLECNVLRKANS